VETIEDKIKSIVEEIHVRLTAGMEIENPNTEIKREWYNLIKAGENYKQDTSGFISELTAIANNCGPWDGFLIIGIAKGGELNNSPFSQCGLRDESDLHNLIIKTVDKPFSVSVISVTTNIDGSDKHLSVIHIPKSLNKPHVMFEYWTSKTIVYKNYTPVKVGSSVRSATRSHLDMMYFDNQKIVPDYALFLKSFTGAGMEFIPDDTSLKITIPIVFENYGRKPIIIVKGNFIILADSSIGINAEQSIPLVAYKMMTSNPPVVMDITTAPIVISSNQAITQNCHFYVPARELKYDFKNNFLETHKDKYFESYILVEVHGNVFESTRNYKFRHKK
jgi:hypothetical protein